MREIVDLVVKVGCLCRIQVGYSSNLVATSVRLVGVGRTTPEDGTRMTVKTLSRNLFSCLKIEKTTRRFRLTVVSS